jgi:GT2 family glycosyltransferase
MNKIAFVILHYCTLQDTIECVDSIKNQIDTKNHQIIIVDNCSPDESGEELKKLYNQENNVIILQNKENLGFARGNNVGFRYAKNECQSDFIVLLNSDTLIIQDNFFDVILNEYERSKFAVLGPYIIKQEKPYNDNPGRNTVITLAQLRKYIWLVRLHLFLNYLYIENVYNNFWRRVKKHKNEDTIKYRCENVRLHGCCLVFSPLYISQLDGIDDRTFLYSEEDILYAQMMKKKLKTVFNPELKIFHKGGKTTKNIISGSLKIRRFQYKELLRSSQILKKVIKE